jgi:hypothetical protein
VRAVSRTATAVLRVTSCCRPANAPPMPKKSAQSTANDAKSRGPEARATTTMVTQPSTPVTRVAAADQPSGTRSPVPCLEVTSASPLVNPRDG